MIVVHRFARFLAIAGTLAALFLWGCANPAGSSGASAFTVTYDGNGATAGTAPSDSTKYQQGASVTVLGNTGGLYAAGDLFAGWNTASDGSGTSYSSGATFKMGNGNVTLYAQWQTVSAKWATAVSSGASDTRFNAAAVDSAGNVYAVGFMSGTGSYSFGNGATAQGASSTSNAVIVKYNAQGVAQWARTVSGANIGSNYSSFNGVAVDSSNNIYVAGYQGGNVAYTYGGSASATGVYNGSNAVLVKYDTLGNAKWARTPSTAPYASTFKAVAVDSSSGDVYAAGYQGKNGTYTYGSQSVSGTYTAGANAVIVKYSAGGTAQWAKSVSAGSSASIFNAVAVDSSGNAYAAGSQTGNSQYTYGSQSVTGGSSNNNFVLVKYDSSGTAKWADTATSSTSGSSWFNGVSTDSAGDLYAVGIQYTTGTFDFGNNTTAAGTSGGVNMVIVQYSEQGAAQWARSTDSTTNCAYSTFEGVATDSDGNADVVGWQEGLCTYGSGVSITSPSSYHTGVVVTYDSLGNALWAQSNSSVPGTSEFTGVAVDSSRNAYPVGFENGTSTYTYGSFSTHGATSGVNAVSVKYGP